MGLDYLANTRHASDSLADIFFTDTEISYRDDNRVMWIYIEDGDEGDDIFKMKLEDKQNQEIEVVLPPQYYDEWDYKYASYKPDWVAVYERLHSHSDATFIDELLDNNIYSKKLKDKFIETSLLFGYINNKFKKIKNKLKKLMENYEILENGLIKQKSIVNKIQTYDTKYVNERYNQYGEKGPQMAGIRLGYLVGTLGYWPQSILDIGYGNGDFLKVCKGVIESYGNDVSGYPVPEGVTYTDNIFDKHYDVISFFDVLEHFEEINFVKDLDCNYVYISLPWCHNFSEEWFMNWKHRRPDEHLWHFNEKSIENFFNEMGYDMVDYSNVEDLIRVSNEEYSNILTCIFKKRK